MNTRSNEVSNPTLKQKILKVVFVGLLGALMGFLAKFFDGSGLGLIGSGLGIWILMTTLLIVWSHSPRLAALHSFVFLTSMLIFYYIYSMILFGFFPKSQFIFWGSIALLSPFGGYMVWHSRRIGWLAGLCAALPISLLIGEGYSFYYAFSVTKGFAILSAILLLIILPQNQGQRLRVLLLAAFILFVLERLGLLYLLSG
jgi:hypothetical protein